MGQNVDHEKIVALFEEIRALFPTLRMELQLDHPQLDLNMEARKQPGLAFDVNLNLQGDELHLSAGSLWLEWFRSSDTEVVNSSRAALQLANDTMVRSVTTLVCLLSACITINAYSTATVVVPIRVHASRGSFNTNFNQSSPKRMSGPASKTSEWLKAMEGNWVNLDVQTEDIKRFTLTLKGNTVTVHMWAQCHPC